MPTIITHALVGLTSAQAAPRTTRALPVIFVSVVVAMAPDLDVVSFSFGIPYEHPLGHRGIAHSISTAIFLAAVLSWLPILYRRRPRLRVRLGVFSVFAAAGVSHGLLDALTNGGRGIGLLLPFSDDRFFFPHRPIEVSAIGLGSFLRSDFTRVLASEVAWVWLPLLAFTILFQTTKTLTARRRRHR